MIRNPSRFFPSIAYPPICHESDASEISLDLWNHRGASARGPDRSLSDSDESG